MKCFRYRDKNWLSHFHCREGETLYVWFYLGHLPVKYSLTSSVCVKLFFKFSGTCRASCNTTLTNQDQLIFMLWLHLVDKPCATPGNSWLRNLENQTLLVHILWKKKSTATSRTTFLNSLLHLPFHNHLINSAYRKTAFNNHLSNPNLSLIDQQLTLLRWPSELQLRIIAPLSSSAELIQVLRSAVHRETLPNGQILKAQKYYFWGACEDDVSYFAFSTTDCNRSCDPLSKKPDDWLLLRHHLWGGGFSGGSFTGPRSCQVGTTFPNLLTTKIKIISCLNEAFHFCLWKSKQWVTTLYYTDVCLFPLFQGVFVPAKAEI